MLRLEDIGSPTNERKMVWTPRFIPFNTLKHLNSLHEDSIYKMVAQIYGIVLRDYAVLSAKSPGPFKCFHD